MKFQGVIIRAEAVAQSYVDVVRVGRLPIGEWDLRLVKYYSCRKS
jgi:hypothetical protein